MRIRSRKDNPYRTEQFQRIPVDDEFPVGVPDFNTRDEHPDIGPHIHDLLEIGYCFDGSGLFLIGDKIFTFKGETRSSSTRTRSTSRAEARGTRPAGDSCTSTRSGCWRTTSAATPTA